MIFNENYDRSLWLMLSDNNREMIIDFVESLPASFCSEIQNAFNKLYSIKNENLSIEDIPEIEFSGEYRTPGDVVYCYSIDYMTGALNLGEYIDDGEERYTKFEMSLYPLKKDETKKMSNLDMHLLGEIYYNHVEYYENDEHYLISADVTDFNLVKLPFGLSSVCSSKTVPALKLNGRMLYQVRNKYNFVDTEMVPYDFDVSTLSCKNRNVLSRKKF